MKLKVTVKELVNLVSDTAGYADHRCTKYDSCCYVCVAKRIKEARMNNELEIEGVNNGKAQRQLNSQ